MRLMICRPPTRGCTAQGTMNEHLGTGNPPLKFASEVCLSHGTLGRRLSMLFHIRDMRSPVQD